MRPLCIYHGDNCIDGFAAAYAVRRALGGTGADFHAGVYSEPPPDVRGRDVIVVDFSYKRPVLEQMADDASSIIVLDHHESAQKDLDGFPQPPDRWAAWLAAFSGNPPLARALRCVTLFDMARSGAGLAWDFFHPNEHRPWLIDLIETRDLWRNTDPARWNSARAAHAYIASFPLTFAAFYEHFQLSAAIGGKGLIMGQGEAILRQADRYVEQILPLTTRTLRIGGHDVPCANCPPWMASDVGHALLLAHPDAPFSASYYDDPTHRRFSLRSTADRVNVSEVALGYGGGGHRNASGFRAALDWSGDP